MTIYRPDWDPHTQDQFITDTIWQHPKELPGDDYKGAPEDMKVTKEEFTSWPNFGGSKVEEMRAARDSQVGGDHYKKLKIQPVEYILANNLGYVEGNVVKYITRWKDKGGVQDLEKIKHYCDLLIEGNK